MPNVTAARRALAVFAAALLILSGVAASAFAASPSSNPSPNRKCPPGIGIGLLQFPSERAADPRARAYVIDHVAPGASFRRMFQVCKGTGAPITARLYAGAAQIAAGQFQLATGDAGNDVTRAITVDPPTLTLAPDAIGVATAVFTVPRDAQAGEQYAAIYAEVAGSGVGPVAARSRAGIRVYLDVGPGGEKRSDFRIDSLQAGRTAAGLPMVSAQVTNTGARALDLEGELRLTNGPGQLSAGPFPVTKGTTLGVGQSEQVQIPLPEQINGGPWTAELTLRSGLLVHKATATITFPEAAGTKADAVPATAADFTAEHRVLLPIAIGLIFLLLVLLILGYLRARRRARLAAGS